jgi:hypothetical protein
MDKTCLVTVREMLTNAGIETVSVKNSLTPGWIGHDGHAATNGLMAVASGKLGEP